MARKKRDLSGNTRAMMGLSDKQPVKNRGEASASESKTNTATNDSMVAMVADTQWDMPKDGSNGTMMPKMQTVAKGPVKQQSSTIDDRPKKVGLSLAPSLYERVREVAYQKRISINMATAEALEIYCAEFERSRQ